MMRGTAAPPMTTSMRTSSLPMRRYSDLRDDKMTSATSATMTKMAPATAMFKRATARTITVPMMAN
eukprot:6896871-Pyramimonas_sp.AAC.1